jgi:hypothetical protein
VAGQPRFIGRWRAVPFTQSALGSLDPNGVYHVFSANLQIGHVELRVWWPAIAGEAGIRLEGLRNRFRTMPSLETKGDQRTASGRIVARPRRAIVVLTKQWTD